MSKLRIEIESLSALRLPNSLHINTSYSPEQQEFFYFPAGSLSSHRNSVTYTEDEMGMNRDTRQEMNEEESSLELGFENIITYTPETPQSLAKGPIYTLEEFVSWEDGTEADVQKNSKFALTFNKDSISEKRKSIFIIKTEEIFEIKPTNVIKNLRSNVEEMKLEINK